MAQLLMNPPTTHYEFFGPPGALLVTLVTPAVSYALYFGCNESNDCLPKLDTDRIVTALSSPQWWASLWDTQATLIYLAWYAFCVLSWVILPGDWVEGTTLRTGGKKKYKINGATFSPHTQRPLCSSALDSLFDIPSRPRYHFWHHSQLRSRVLYVPLQKMGWVLDRVHSHGSGPGIILLRVLLPLWRSSCSGWKHRKRHIRCMSLLLSYCVPTLTFTQFFIGRELNPSIGSFDIKSFNELRPGLILWVLINISMACEQAVRRGGLSKVTDSMWLVLAFQFWYVADGLYNEPALFTTMDITSDGFGFMLAIGDLAWVPFTYSVQARYLAFHPVELGPIRTAAIIGVNLLGYWIFRSANNEKNEFRNGNNPKSMLSRPPTSSLTFPHVCLPLDLKFMETKRGTKLLISGWWGLSQHPNYL